MGRTMVVQACGGRHNKSLHDHAGPQAWWPADARPGGQPTPGQAAGPTVGLVAGRPAGQAGRPRCWLAEGGAEVFEEVVAGLEADREADEVGRHLQG
jgi:hypothetical protein